MLRHYINFFNAMPMVIVLPLVSLWFGYTSGARLATIVFAAIFSIILNTTDGARTVPREHLEVANSFRSRKLRTILEVVLPASTPYVLAGLRLAAGRALIGAVVAEFFLAIGVLGYYILYNSRTFHRERTTALACVIKCRHWLQPRRITYCVRRSTFECPRSTSSIPQKTRRT